MKKDQSKAEESTEKKSSQVESEAEKQDKQAEATKTEAKQPVVKEEQSKSDQEDVKSQPDKKPTKSKSSPDKEEQKPEKAEQSKSDQEETADKEKEKSEGKPTEEAEKTGEKTDEGKAKPDEDKKGKPRDDRRQLDSLDEWKPVTQLGKLVKEGKITDIDALLDQGLDIREKEIVETLVPGIESDLLLVGQAKGKFGGGKRRVFRQTQKKTREGNKPHFATYAVVGNRNGYVGVGYGKSKETVPAREKAIRRAKLNFMKVRRGCGSWQCGCGEPHTIPFAVEGKCSSVVIKLMPAPKGKGLVVEKECQKILELAGIRDIWSKTKGQTRKKTNLIAACMDALQKLAVTKVRPGDFAKLGIVEGKHIAPEPEEAEPVQNES
jgi:small subunit ribosomal protein S5